VPHREFRWTELDVRAVRGPLTGQVLRDRGLQVPDVYGDPGLLMPVLFPQLRRDAPAKARDLLIAPNLNDRTLYDPDDPRVLDVTMPVSHCVQRIAESERVVGSALHAVIVAESLGIPARAISSPVESPFKYMDYYAGTGRSGVEIARSLEEAIQMGGAPPLSWSPDRIMEAFPYDLWQPRHADGSG
jgi:pyruvyltransferase